ncbi:TPA: bifunctional protein-disulfide isomerase/oxidoreductase DsbC [Vibrio parahaemolyticus]|uniref:bifunctional protein-disulfide isomerase/oxidoreductase DsbC n=1 Tax=Vibrio parahaemolyticus TaxID=670 RepID=UPI00084A60E7|nr:bifunctional protein-disulfide isomerase/oxidoreductase DsbC [Vibrio parahaemolyticus]ODZ30638.1 thiol:disulfide interchange protein [Vibrio parahaemolyticus]ODZ35581.1 thiol:disulfide interchange protein [Vibrio parahaemolyticus]OHX58420.1 thiol:disulfide interchange protein [Vibrio parahaemolyticus]HCG7967201.1 bifunctional protein-disulfide isomerase/oxidoreductase DsbC [Vibrio parahaemolyticus]
MSVLRRLTLLTLPFFITACGAEESQAKTETPAQQAAPTAQQHFDEAALKAKFSKLGLSIIDIQPSDVTGLLEIQTNGGILFASNNGDHFIAGTLYAIDDNGGYKDVLAERQAPLNAEKIAKFADSMIEYKADNEKYVVTVFTDITCGYCVRLHNQMQGYNDLGITVRYMAYPRQGATGPVAEQMATIWCAEDPKAAMHNAKVSRTFDNPAKDLEQCKETIQAHYNVGRQLGISGTPAIFLPNGEMVGGYLPPAELLKRLEQL